MKEFASVRALAPVCRGDATPTRVTFANHRAAAAFPKAYDFCFVF